MTRRLTREHDESLWLLLVQARDAIRKARQKELNQYGISVRQSAVLSAIEAIGDKATPAEISRWTLREPHSVSEVLNRMEKAGLVQKVKDLDRKNLVRVTLTNKGREVHSKASVTECIPTIISRLPPKDRAQLASYLQTLRDEALRFMWSGEMTYPPP
ncbi:MAG: winged helix-turn-helix transcriptional regulator [Chloroflexi bacterium]|nr:winged helix-turn-helix transcriptional regulator [Chloroflexota bacterium]